MCVSTKLNYLQKFLPFLYFLWKRDEIIGGYLKLSLKTCEKEMYKR